MKSLLKALVAIAVSSVPVSGAYGALTIDGIPDSDYQALSSTYAGQAFYFGYSYQGANYVEGSGVRLNQYYGLTAAHCVENSAGTLLTNFASSIFIGTGSNFNTDPGDIRQISAVTIVPGYDYTATTNPFNSPDFAIVKFDQPLPGKDLTIAPVADGSLVTTVGYGVHGTSNGGTLSSDGNRRAFNSIAISDQYTSDPSVRVEFNYFDVANYVSYLNGQGEPGDSGGPGFDQAGNLVSITDDATIGTGFSGYTNSTRLAPYADWIAANTQAPEPSSLMLIIPPIILFFGKRKSRKSKTDRIN